MSEVSKQACATMFNRRSSIRRVAVQMLLLWVFALGVGVAHACVVASKPKSNDHGGEVISATAGHHHAATAADDDKPIEQAGKATCLKFCDDTRAVSTLPDTSGDLPPTGLAPIWFVPWADGRPLVAALIVARAQGLRDRTPLPIAINFLRLAL